MASPPAASRTPVDPPVWLAPVLMVPAVLLMFLSVVYLGAGFAAAGHELSSPLTPAEQQAIPIKAHEGMLGFGALSGLCWIGVFWSLVKYQRRTNKPVTVTALIAIAVLGLATLQLGVRAGMRANFLKPLEQRSAPALRPSKEEHERQQRQWEGAFSIG